MQDDQQNPVMQAVLGDADNALSATEQAYHPPGAEDFRRQETAGGGRQTSWMEEDLKRAEDPEERAKMLASIKEAAREDDERRLKELRAMHPEISPLLDQAKERYTENRRNSEHPQTVPPPDYRTTTPTHVEASPAPASLRQEKQSFGSKLKRFASTVRDQAQLSSIMIAQFGGIHPQRIDGKWGWVVEPWANIANDPNDYYQDRPNVFIDRFRKPEGTKRTMIGRDELPHGELPTIRPVGLGRLQYLNHKRVQAAQAVKRPIPVQFSREKTFS